MSEKARAAALARRGVALAVPLAAPCLLLTVSTYLVIGFGSFATQQTAVNALINVMIVVGMYVFVGNSGIVSFGHVGFVSIGAYLTALLTIPEAQKSFLFPNFPPSIAFVIHAHLGWVGSALVAAGFTAAVAAVIGFPLMRLPIFQAGMATLSLLIVINVVISSWQSVTDGTGTIIGVPNQASLPTTLVATLLAVVCAYLYQISRPALRLRASREDHFAARAVGVNVVLERWIAFALSAFIVGAAGAMYAYFIPFSSSSFYLSLTFLTVAMLIIGGRNSLWGAVTGAVLISFLSEVFRRIEAGTSVLGVHFSIPVGSTEVLIALSMLGILILRPEGITGGKEFSLPDPRRLRRSRAPEEKPRRTQPAADGENAPTPDRSG